MLQQTIPSAWRRWLDKHNGKDLYYLSDEDRRMIASFHQREPEISGMKSDRLGRYGKWLATRAQRGEALVRIMPDTFGALREAGKRVLNIRANDALLASALMIVAGRLPMLAPDSDTSLALFFPAFLYALEGKGTHVLYSDEAVAKSDFERLKELYAFMGVSVALIEETSGAEERSEAYAKDITYLPIDIAIRDFLSTQQQEAKDRDQRPLHAGLVHEAAAMLKQPVVRLGEAEEDTGLSTRNFLESYPTLCALTRADLETAPHLQRYFDRQVAPIPSS